MTQPEIDWMEYFSRLEQRQAKLERKQTQRIERKDLYTFIRLMLVVVTIIVLTTEVHWW